MNNTYYNAAANWWASKIRKPKSSSFNMGTDKLLYLMSTIVAEENAQAAKPKDSAVDAFEKRLAEVIRNQVEERGSMIIVTDYHPDQTLSAVAKEAGVNAESFPWKTYMRISPKEVTVTCGRGAPKETVFLA